MFPKKTSNIYTKSILKIFFTNLCLPLCKNQELKSKIQNYLKKIKTNNAEEEKQKLSEYYKSLNITCESIDYYVFWSAYSFYSFWYCDYYYSAQALTKAKKK